MAAEGARLTSFYASASVCTPSRAGLLTGRYPIRTGLAKDVIRQTDTHGLPLSEITIAEALKPDYATALVGKWHLGHVAPFWPPTQHGFDVFFGLPYSHDMKPLSLYTKEPGVELTSEDPAMDKLTDRFFQRGFRYIEENRDRPFFLMLTLTAPHIPLDPHPDHAGHSMAAEYGDVVEEIDANVGRLFAKLKELTSMTTRSSFSHPTMARGSKAQPPVCVTARAAQAGMAAIACPSSRATPAASRLASSTTAWR